MLLIVNVASRCGFTAHYQQLELWHQRYQARGFSVLAFPCNQFGGQEPGTNAQIQSFCQTRFAVTFPVFAKIDVTGAVAAEITVLRPHSLQSQLPLPSDAVLNSSSTI